MKILSVIINLTMNTRQNSKQFNNFSKLDETIKNGMCKYKKSQENEALYQIQDIHNEFEEASLRGDDCISLLGERGELCRSVKDELLSLGYKIYKQHIGIVIIPPDMKEHKPDNTQTTVSESSQSNQVQNYKKRKNCETETYTPSAKELEGLGLYKTTN